MPPNPLAMCMASPCAAYRFTTCKFPNLKNFLAPPPKSWGRPCLTKLPCITVVDNALYNSSRMSVEDPSNSGYNLFTEGFVFDIKRNIIIGD